MSKFRVRGGRIRRTRKLTRQEIIGYSTVFLMYAIGHGALFSVWYFFLAK